MSVLGIDIGNENCYIAVARSGGIETIDNEYSQRNTPSYIAFGKKDRLMGVAAKNKHSSDHLNTVNCFKRLIGKKFKDPLVNEEGNYVTFRTEDITERIIGLTTEDVEVLGHDLGKKLVEGNLGISVDYMNEKHVFTATQVMAMMLTKLKGISETNLQMKVQDCVLSVPAYYNDNERKAILDAAQIAGLHVLKLMNDTTAVALAYGFYRQDIAEDKPKKVVFVDLGQASLQACACEFTKEKLKILGATWHRNLGGRDFDYVLVKHFCSDFKKRYDINVRNDKKGKVRLMTECEKLKKQMSANSRELNLAIECFMKKNDGSMLDVTGKMKREDFEVLCKQLFVQIEVVLLQLLQNTGLKPGEIDSVQIVGGSSRIPAFKAIIQKVFGMEPSTTLNQDEAVARGCALQCAMLSPNCRAREISITDCLPYPVEINYTVCDDQDGKKKDYVSKIETMEVFPAFHQYPFSKLLTFYRTSPFSLNVHFADEYKDNLFFMGRYTIQDITRTADGGSSQVKVKARINKNGIFSFSSPVMKVVVPASSSGVTAQETDKSATTSDNVQDKSELNPENKTEAVDMDNSSPTEPMDSGDISKKEDSDQKKGKNLVKTIDLPMEVKFAAHLSPKQINKFTEIEVQMINQDKMEKEKSDAKNALEEYVYDFRDKVADMLASFVTEQESASIGKMLDETENWLYDDGDDQQKSVYVQKLNALKKQGDPITLRYAEWAYRPNALEGFGGTIQMIRKVLHAYEAKDPNYSHLDEEDMKQVLKILEEKERWHGQYLVALSKLSKHEDPPVTIAQITSQEKELRDRCFPIIQKPKPKVEPPPTSVNGQPETDSEMQDTSSGNSSEKAENKESGKQDGSKNQAEAMETN